METIKQSNCKQSGRCPPDFVYAVIWAQFGLFSVFSVVSIYQQANSGFPDLIQIAWSGALIVTLGVLAVNIVARVLLRTSK